MGLTTELVAVERMATMTSLKTFVFRCAIASVMVGAGVFTGVKLATANPGGPTGDQLTFTGVSRERAMRSTTLVFVFRKPSTAGAPGCTVTTESFTPDVNGAFSVIVPLGACPGRGAFFDGDDVVYDVHLDTATGDTLATNVSVTAVPYARFADQAGVKNACPVGFSSDAPPSAGVTLCVRTVRGLRDEMVKVGRGASAFWVDRYEATVVDSNARRLNDEMQVYPDVSQTGTWVSSQREASFAMSLSGMNPSRNMTWFQATAFCRAAGKRLMSRDEWFAAADGLAAIDPATPVDGALRDEARCNTHSNTVRATGYGTACASSWGAQDLIGNVSEWTNEWYANAGVLDPSFYSRDVLTGRRVVSPLSTGSYYGWPGTYNSDATWNVSSVVLRVPGEDGISGVPSAAVRGGNRIDGVNAGVFAMSLNLAPSAWSQYVGFRCVIDR